MQIQFQQLPTVLNHISNAIFNGNKWLGIDLSIEQLHPTDLNFFKSRVDGLNFCEFNETNAKEIYLFNAKEALDMIEHFGRIELSRNPGATSTLLFLKDLSDMNRMANINGELAPLVFEMDKYDWEKIKYEPTKINFDSIGEKIEYNRIEWLVEQLSAFSAIDRQKNEMVEDYLYHYWWKSPMEKHIQPVLNGEYGEKAQLLINNKNKTMNAENLEYLEKQLLYSGFGEGLKTQLERKLKEGHPDFQLNASHEFGKDKMEAVLYFSKSKQEGSDKYFFNKYDATLNNAHGNFQQTFFINNKGQSITFKEACNLLNGRSVYKELTPKEGARYKAWVKLDFNNRDEHGNAKLNIFNEKYGFSLKEALGRIPLQELKDPEKMAALFTALEGGNLAKATLIKSDREMDVQLAADPKFKTVKMFDMEGVKLYVPAQKQEKQYGNAPIDEKLGAEGKVMEVGQPLEPAKQQDNRQTNETKQGDAVAMNNRPQSQKPNDKPLLEKKRVKSKGRKIA